MIYIYHEITRLFLNFIFSLLHDSVNLPEEVSKPDAEIEDGLKYTLIYMFNKRMN